MNQITRSALITAHDAYVRSLSTALARSEPGSALTHDVNSERPSIRHVTVVEKGSVSLRVEYNGAVATLHIPVTNPPIQLKDYMDRYDISNRYLGLFHLVVV